MLAAVGLLCGLYLLYAARVNATLRELQVQYAGALFTTAGGSAESALAGLQDGEQQLLQESAESLQQLESRCVSWQAQTTKRTNSHRACNSEQVKGSECGSSLAPSFALCSSRKGIVLRLWTPHNAVMGDTC